jgi:hypothetical protein
MTKKEAISRSMKYLYKVININEKELEKIKDEKGLEVFKVVKEILNKDKEAYQILKNMYEKEKF